MSVEEPVGRRATPTEQDELDYSVMVHRKAVRFLNLYGIAAARAAPVVGIALGGARIVSIGRGFTLHPDDRGALMGKTR